MDMYIDLDIAKKHLNIEPDFTEDDDNDGQYSRGSADGGVSEETDRGRGGVGGQGDIDEIVADEDGVQHLRPVAGDAEDVRRPEKRVRLFESGAELPLRDVGEREAAPLPVPEKRLFFVDALSSHKYHRFGALTAGASCKSRRP